jgi:hypothetical protein
MSLIGRRVKFIKDRSKYEGIVVDKYLAENNSNYPGFTKYLVVLDNNTVMRVNPNEITEVVAFNQN